jgi:hypothetical protein
VRLLCSSPAEAREAVRALTAALLDPIGAGDGDLAPVARALAGARALAVAGPAELAVRACSGELAMIPGAATLDPSSPAGRAQLEAWRARAHGFASVALGAIGPQALIDAAADAHATTPAWPAGTEPDDAWPALDSFGVEGDDARRRRASVALRLASPSAALEAARVLGAPASRVAERLAALEPAWSVERVLASARPRGACLRVDVAPTGQEAPEPTALAAALLIAEQEAERAARAVSEDLVALEAAALAPADPREAAAAAAWRLLAARLRPGPTRRSRLWLTRRAEAGPAAARVLERELGRVAARPPGVELRSRFEPGQGETWMLLASPCGTAGEASEDAGAGALAMHALGGREAAGDVALEPWISPDGLGLLAHGARRPGESTEAHAERVADALGRALAARRASSGRVAAALPELLDAIGPGSAPAREAAWQALCPGRPSWLEPRGTWRALSGLGPETADARRRALLAGPLRLAVLANADEHQATTARSAVERWLLPLPRSAACPSGPPPAPTPGERRIDDPDRGPRAIVAVRLDPAPANAAPDAAHWTALLLGRPGGWLDAALGRPALATATARVLGGARARSLVVEIHAAPGSVAAAVAQTRALLDRLSRGAAGAADVETLVTETAHLEDEAHLDPRRRIVDVWHGVDAAPVPELATLRRLQRQLAAERHVVIVAEPK